MFIVSVYDLSVGGDKEIHREEYSDVVEALTSYYHAVKHYYNETDGCFGVMLFTDSGNIVYGF